MARHTPRCTCDSTSDLHAADCPMSRFITATHAAIALKTLAAVRDGHLAAPAELRFAAAAPELYDALKDLLENYFWQEGNCYVKAARAAIARAEEP